ncbi:Kinase superfamily protein isoform 1 [Hibiscus syriacus]|uniref:Kinase superfamily protein isoform 1 n=1 Tax=Hibiscus syriacus TaxID=106335 RepID=A0A6A2ZGV4_HIBSY|nr:remorin 1.4-like [Hibiscus syriacus]KAE8690820.1 Kinase superfamily protein isoform 1 [Hibiscus syriacus]
MRSIEDKTCYSLGPANEISSSSNGGAINFEFHRPALGKEPMAPSKWDDAQKWLVGLSRSRDKRAQSKAKPARDSNADDTRLIAPCPQKEQDYPSSEDEAQTVGLDLAIWNSVSGVRSICVRDMGTEMTPVASQEQSRTTTPLRATTPAGRSPISSGSSTPVRPHQGDRAGSGIDVAAKGNGSNRLNRQESGQASKQTSLETRAMAWDEAERAKYMARYKREEVKIQAWENHEKRKAELEMKKIEVKAESLRARAKERCANKLAATRRVAEEKRANAESKLNEKDIRTSQRADYIRRTGHFPSSFSFKLPSLCW